MNFKEAMVETSEQAKRDNKIFYLYKQGGKFPWGISHLYRSSWLFKAYPGGRKILSILGNELLQKEPVEKIE